VRNGGSRGRREGGWFYKGVSRSEGHRAIRTPSAKIIVVAAFLWELREVGAALGTKDAVRWVRGKRVSPDILVVGEECAAALGPGDVSGGAR